jgi:hypothetical protein
MIKRYAMSRRRYLALATAVCPGWPLSAGSDDTEQSTASLKFSPEERMLFAANIRRVAQSLTYLQQPLPSREEERLLALSDGDAKLDQAVDAILDKYTLIRLRLDSEGVGFSTPGAAKHELLDLGCRAFLVRPENPTRLKGKLILAGRTPVFENEGPEIPDGYPLQASARWMGYRTGSGNLRSELEASDRVRGHSNLFAGGRGEEENLSGAVFIVA